MTIDLAGVPIQLAPADEFEGRWIGQEEPMRQLLASWYVLGATDVPMTPRLVGKPGAGKTTLACAAARRLAREIYILQATSETTPADLILTVAGETHYLASPLVTAMIRGGVCVLDEANRMSERCWASLAPLLDHRRYVESLEAGLKIKAHPLFRLVATMNEDSSTFDLPAYIHSRLQPRILIDFPDEAEELAILRENLPFADDHMLRYVSGFLKQAHAMEENFSVRDGINTVRYAMKLHLHLGIDRKSALRQALTHTVGASGLAYAPKVIPEALS
jgi:MoxR-like ATPase